MVISVDLSFSNWSTWIHLQSVASILLFQGLEPVKYNPNLTIVIPSDVCLIYTLSWMDQPKRHHHLCDDLSLSSCLIRPENPNKTLILKVWPLVFKTKTDWSVSRRIVAAPCVRVRRFISSELNVSYWTGPLNYVSSRGVTGCDVTD